MIHHIKREDLHHAYLLAQIYDDMSHHYYWSDDFSPQMYMDLANAGFISVTIEYESELFLLAEIQKSYAVLMFENLHISKKVAKLQRNAAYELRFNSCCYKVIEKIQEAFDSCWMVGEYVDLMLALQQNSYDGFELLSVELFDGENHLVAGEIGYITANKVYTSLTGFHSDKRCYSSWGTLQLVLLAQHLQKRGVRFWNMGHPYMPYKFKLGATELDRETFLSLWHKE